MSWKYEDMKRDGVDPHTLTCRCGHLGEDHHAVYWPLGMTLDECEAYGFNETGGMRRTWTGWLFGRVIPQRHPSYGPAAVDAAGTRRYAPPVWPRQRLRDLLRRVPGLRGPWYVDHCHHFEERA